MATAATETRIETALHNPECIRITFEFFKGGGKDGADIYQTISWGWSEETDRHYVIDAAQGATLQKAVRSLVR